ncbi:MAG: monofunctional biosynthetic peptidoglycan transglycosylase [Candidatus Aminicenantes bacterium]|nr:monofunctional biosynthetic peptidoglycan transglycosylase [Candidatus Aminicenantes bacterium]
MKRSRKRLLLILFLPIWLALVFTAVNLIHPRVGRLRDHNPELTAFQKHRLDQWAKQGAKRHITSRWRPLSRISPSLVEAVLIAEDDGFWAHAGFDWEAMREAMVKNWKKKTLRYGGSTITQQLAKNLYLSPSRSLVRKLREAILAWRLERALSKKRILEIYLNVVEWGDGIFGAEAAAGHYYGKSASRLSPPEAARLAAILPMPRRYTRSSFHRSRYLDERVATIMDVMRRRGLVPEGDPPAMSPFLRTAF